MAAELTALFWIQKLMALAILWQTIEFFQIKSVFSESGVWTWKILKQEFEIFPRPISTLLSIVLKENGFLWILRLRLAAALALLFFPSSLFVWILLLTTLLVCLRWRGVFNGGSDYMTLVVLLSLTIATTFQDHVLVVKASLWYLGLQVVLSYFLAGLVKVRNRDWRCGKELSSILRNATSLTGIRKIAEAPVLAAIASILILAFECLFPLSLLGPGFAKVFLLMAFAFHLLNVVIFGLNRFFWAWISSYPALYYCSFYILQA